MRRAVAGFLRPAPLAAEVCSVGLRWGRPAGCVWPAVTGEGASLARCPYPSPLFRAASCEERSSRRWRDLFPAPAAAAALRLSPQPSPQSARSRPGPPRARSQPLPLFPRPKRSGGKRRRPLRGDRFPPAPPA